MTGVLVVILCLATTPICTKEHALELREYRMAPAQCPVIAQQLMASTVTPEYRFAVGCYFAIFA